MRFCGERIYGMPILTMGALVVGTEKAKMIARHWLNAEFEDGRHQRRIDMIEKIENGEDPETEKEKE